MKKNFTCLKAFFLMMLLVVGSGGMYAQNVTWELITSVKDLTAGEYLLSSINGNTVFKGTISSGHGQSVSVADVVIDNTIPGDKLPASALVLTFTQTGTNVYTISDSDGAYLGASKASSGGLALDAKYSTFNWTFSDNTKGLLMQGKVGNATVNLRSYSNTTFRTYGSASNDDVVLYKKVVGSSLPQPEFSFSANEATVILGQELVAPTLTNNSDGAVTYASSNEAVATVSNNGVVTVLTGGTTDIMATVSETAVFAGASAKYKLVVVNPYAFETNLDFSSNDNWKFPAAPALVESVHTNGGVSCVVYNAKYLQNAGLFINEKSGYILLPVTDKQVPEKVLVTTPGGTIGASASLKLIINEKEISTTVVGQKNTTYTITIPKVNQKAGLQVKLVATGANVQIAKMELSGSVVLSDITSDKLEFVTAFDKEITASGDWTQDNIETLALAISGNATPVTSVKFTGNVTSANDGILELAPNCLKIFADGVNAPQAWTVNVVKLDAGGNATSANISLDANSAFGTPVKIKADNVSFVRENMVAGNKSTLYLPFAVNLSEGYTAYSFSSVTGTTVKFAPVEGTLAANTPYLIVVGGSDVNINEMNVDIMPETHPLITDGYQFLGTYETISAEGFYGFKDNSFRQGGEKATVPPFRAYLKPAIQTSGAPAILGIDISGEGTTGIESVVFEGTTVYATDGMINVLTDTAQQIAVYGVDGRLVRMEMVHPGENSIGGLDKGIYIVNNCKVILK